MMQFVPSINVFASADARQSGVENSSSQHLYIKDLNKLIYIAILFLLGCNSAERESNTVKQYYTESTLGFYDPSDKDFTLTKWIRKPENIRMVHETFKKFGYINIFSDYDLTSNPCMIWSYINKPCINIIDSLMLTYPTREIAPKYYREFWARRRQEQNDTTVFAILREIKAELINKEVVGFRENLTNDTIYNLLRIKYAGSVDERTALKNFEYLRTIGLNLSAYNMLFEWAPYEDLKWDREKLKKTLATDTLYCCSNPIIEDNTK